VQIIMNIVLLLLCAMFSDQIPRLELFSTSLTSLATNVRRDWLEICLHLRITLDAIEMISTGEEKRAIGERNLFDDLQAMETHRR
jgi:hypothetical protein